MDRSHPWGWRALSAGVFVAIVGGIVLGILNANDLLPDWFFGASPGDDDDRPAGVLGFSGGCEPFEVFAQNRWTPVGTAIRTRPKVTTQMVDDVPPNIPIEVDGWVHGEVAYPYNSPPFDNDIWFHMADDSGWVSFAGVRAVPTEPDPTLRSPDGGQPAVASPECEGSIAQ